MNPIKNENKKKHPGYVVPIHEKEWIPDVFNSEMSNFFTEQGRTRVYAEADFMSVAGKNPRRTPLSGKRAIYGWTLGNPLPCICDKPAA